jgi:cell wall-associated NlpC family hydrolase
VRRSDGVRRGDPSRRAVILLLLMALLGGMLSGTAAGEPEPPPPPNPSDEELDRSRASVTQRADEVGRLTARLAELDARADDLAAALAVERENAEAALVALDTARAAAAAAAERAEAARVETEAATAAIDAATERVDAFAVATYQQGGLDLGPLGLLSTATSPEDLLARAELEDAIARSQLSARDSLERARVAKANADAAARAALEEAREREAEAAAAKVAADAALATAEEAAATAAAELAAVDAERAEVQRLLDAAVAADAGLREQRARFQDWQDRMAAAQAARDRADQAAARNRAGDRIDPGLRGGAAVERVIDRAMSQVGVQYVWGGGSGRGPTTGIPDRFGSPLNRIGFDCSGLMLYAFNGVGINLPRVSRNQFNAGQKVPISELRPGDMVFYKNGGAPIHHVALYIGDGKMIEAPYTGASVRVVPLRKRGLLPHATRMI